MSNLPNVSDHSSDLDLYSTNFRFSPSSLDFFNSLIDQENFNFDNNATIETEIRVSASHSSTEANNHPNSGEDSGKRRRKIEAADAMTGGDGGQEDQRSQKVCKTEKKQIVSFMTKTEVEHLEDGYRWRKYGQKAVKNSPHPRSYYRCTTQKCRVKKRVERYYQNPTMVITTYENQHNHPLPSNLRTPSHLFRTDFTNRGRSGCGCGGCGGDAVEAVGDQSYDYNGNVNLITTSCDHHQHEKSEF